jgi:membrane-associated phospholipid phosphatase
MRINRPTANRIIELPPEIWLYLATVLFTMSATLINSLGHGFHIGFFHSENLVPFWAMVLASVLVIGFAFSVESEKPKVALIGSSTAQIFLIFCLWSFMWPALVTTPFPLQDHYLHELDAHFNYDIGTIYLWSRRNGLLEGFMSHWKTIAIPITLAPILLAIFSEKRSVRIYVTMLLFSGLVGGLTYYFIPTTAPAAVLPAIEFPYQQYILIERFDIIHQHGVYDDYRTGGVAGFPSFHNIWAATLMICFRNTPRPLRFVVFVYGGLTIMSTVLTGWHFLVDIVAGLLVAVASAIVAGYLIPPAHVTETKRESTRA